MWKQLSVFLFFVGIFCSYGQKEISGVIKNSKGESVPFANVVVKDSTETQKPITYAYSDNEGNFTLEISAKIKQIIISVTGIGYKEKITVVQVNNLTKPLVIIVEESLTELETVVLKAKKQTDTLNIDTESMNLSKESTLRDMLNKTEGVILGEEGAISYQGKQINKILINGKEVFINQNTVALDNLNYEIMENVQIIDNYKDKFTLDFKRIRDPVINIETKSQFKGVLKTQINLGYGFKDKYRLNGKGFFFSDKLNVFATSHTNNTGTKQLSEKDVSAAVRRYATEELNKILYPFFVEDYQTTRNFVTNNSLTLRWQGLNSKSGVVLYHGNINTKRDVEYNTFIGDTLLNKSNLRNTDNGNFLSATANYSRILSPKTVLQNVLSTVAIDFKKENNNIDSIFVSNTTFLQEQAQYNPKNFTLNNALKITHLLGDNTAFNTNLDYYYEKNTKDFETRLTNIDVEDVFQQGSSTKNYIRGLVNFNFRFKKATLNTGLAINNNNEKGNLALVNNINTNSELERNITTVESIVSLNGSIKDLDYGFSVIPSLIFTQNTRVREFLKMSHFLKYNFEAQNNLIIRVKHNYEFYQLNALYDTIVRNFNNRIVNENGNENLERFSVKDEVSLSWFNSNVARSKNINFEYRYTQEQDFLQSVLDSISDNIFYYSNSVFDKKQAHTIRAGAKKGVYLGSSYHRLDIGGGFNFRASRYTTRFNSQNARANSNLWEPSFKVSFLPRKFFIKEISNNIKWNNLTFKINGDDITKQSITTNTFMVKGHSDKINWQFDFDYTFYDINDDRFNVPDCNLSLKYDVSDKLSFSLEGRSLLTLFELNNFNFANTLSEGNTLTQVRTENNLGYLILYTSFKF
ncbi:carboxypeptidase-like protein [Kordia periserrulae]|uniref:Carboxypeptidase-like protein n=1 Tax=Kordia periserrulae TaxID=701523 RepID=A0A2T6BUU2_9FLAO|nr:carboxypeptidase-like regulatory domain-containing protein [Kordia periserrulae]PTX59835.1 carboxypeptidase-like protein [Kordia periserrulae]